MQIQSVFACIYAHKKLSAFIYISNLMSEGEPMKKEKRFSLLLPVVVCSILAITIYFQMTTGVISVSNTVNGKELPIYCVDTKEPKIAISFDAACAGCSLRKL